MTVRRVAVLLAAGALSARRLRRRPIRRARARARPPRVRRLSIATGNTTGVYYVARRRARRPDRQDHPRLPGDAEATGASVENIQRVVRGDSDIAFTLADTAADAVAGKGAFTAPAADPRPRPASTTTTPRWSSRTDAGDHVRRRPEGQAGLHRLAELRHRGHRAAPAHRGRARPRQGHPPAVAVDLPKSVQGMKDGTLDALVWSGGLPTGGITDLLTTLGDKVTFVAAGRRAARDAEEHGPVYQEGTIPKDVYKTPADVSTIVGAQPARGERGDGRQPRGEPDQDALRPQGRPGEGPRRPPRSITLRRRPARPTRCPCTTARRSTTADRRREPLADLIHPRAYPAAIRGMNRRLISDLIRPRVFGSHPKYGPPADPGWDSPARVSRRHGVEDLLRLPPGVVDHLDDAVGAEVEVARPRVSGEGEPERAVHALLLEDVEQSVK